MRRSPAAAPAAVASAGTPGGQPAPLDVAVKNRSRTSGCVYLTVPGKQGWTATPTRTKPLRRSSKPSSTLSPKETL